MPLHLPAPCELLKSSCCFKRRSRHVERVERSIWVEPRSQKTVANWLSFRIAVDVDRMPCSPLEVNRYFGGKCRLHLHGRIISDVRNEHEAGEKLILMLVPSSYNSFDFQRTTRRCIPEDNPLQILLRLADGDNHHHQLHLVVCSDNKSYNCSF
jgi:hypothetical protein